MISKEYAAGFFDGEGCVNITVCGKSKQATLRIFITNTNIDVLNLFKNQFGGSIIENKCNKSHWKRGFSLDMRGKTGINFLNYIKDICIVKKKQIDLALEFWEFMHLPRKERCDSVPCPTKKSPYHHILVRKKEVLEKEMDYKNKMSILNKKGKVIEITT